jgi:hypothetical protein
MAHGGEQNYMTSYIAPVHKIEDKLLSGSEFESGSTFSYTENL